MKRKRGSGKNLSGVKGKPLFLRTLLAFTAAFLLLFVILTSVFIFGLDRSITGWNRTRGEDLQSTVLPRLQQLYQRNGHLSGDTIEEALLPFLSPSLYLYVFDTGGLPVFAYRVGERFDQNFREGRGQNFIQRHQDEINPVAIEVEGNTVGYLSAGTVGFVSDEANRKFLDTILVTASAGAVSAFLLALLFAFLFSSRLSSRIRTLADGLTRLSHGARNIVFDTGGPRELRTIAASAQSLQQQLVREAELRNQWAMDVAHDLRTPIAALRAQFEGMLDGVLDISGSRIERANGELLRIEALVHDLSELTRIESPEMRPKDEAVSAGVFLGELCDRFSPLARQRGIAFTCRSSELEFQGDPHLLMRAVSNIVQNALQHCRPHSDTERCSVQLHLDILTAEPTAPEISGNSPQSSPGKESLLEWTVENTGTIPEEEIPRVFDRMYRGEASRTTPGSGSGLAITKAVAELYNGNVSISNSDHGTTVVRFSIPFRTASQARTHQS